MSDMKHETAAHFSRPGRGLRRQPLARAPPAVRDALFDIAEGTVRYLRDRKLILRAEPRGAPSKRSAAAATDLR